MSSWRSDVSRFHNAKNNNKPCLVIGNGPSLKETFTKHRDFFNNKTLFCVNDFITSPYFEQLKPQFCIFADPLWWQEKLSPKFKILCTMLNDKLAKEVDWDFDIFMPVAAKKWNNFMTLPQKNRWIKIYYINTTPIEGSQKFRHFFYKHNLAMPLAQNVLVATLFLAMNMNYRKIYLVGADHSWHEDIHIDRNNRLLMKYIRFQDKSRGKVESKPFYFDAEEKIPYNIANLLRDLSRMFRSYLELEEYAKNIGAKICNASAKSFIDAFERRNLK